MKARLLLAGILLAQWCARAEVICALGSGVTSYKPAQDQRPTPDALELAKRVNTAVRAICGDQCPTMALFRNPTAPNAMLINDGGGTAKIVYSPQFFGASYGSFGDGGILAILAHELGHALDATMGAAFVNPAWNPEVRADSWAGCVLAKMNLTANDVQSSLRALSKYTPASQTGWNQRLPAIRTGFTKCGGDGSKFDRRN